MLIAKKICLIVGPIILLMVVAAGLLLGALFAWQVIWGVGVGLNEALCELRWRLTP